MSRLSTKTATQVNPSNVSDKTTPERRKAEQLPFSLRTIKRDLRILEDSQYQFAIRICSGANRVKQVDLQDFSPPEEVLAAWRATRSRKKPPQLVVFEELGTVVSKLIEERRKLYETYRIDVRVYQSVPGSLLADCLAAFDKLKALSDLELEAVLVHYEAARDRFLFDEIKPLLTAGRCCEELTQRRLEVYANRFPSLERIQKKFGVERVGPFKIDTERDTLSQDVEAQVLQAQREQAELEASEARTRREQLEAEHELELARLSAAEREVRAHAWAVEQAERERVEAEQAVRRQEQAAYAESLRYQRQQFSSAVDEKVREVQQQVLELLHHNLQKIVSKEYKPGNLPPGLTRQLQEITDSADLLAKTDRSLEAVVRRLHNVQSTVSAPAQNPDPTTVQNALRDQVSALLEQVSLQLNLREPEVDNDPSLPSFEDDRALWVQW